MKILSKVNETEWTVRHKCLTCDSELEVESDDLHHKYWPGDFRDPGYDEFYAECAVCGTRFCISNDLIPKIIQIRARNRTRPYL